VSFTQRAVAAVCYEVEPLEGPVRIAVQSKLIANEQLPPDGMLLHLRDTYPIETAWAPQRVGDEFRRVRTAAREARLAASCQTMHHAYTEREAVFAAVMADRADWEQATRQQRHLAVAAEVRRRYPDQRFAPLRSAEPGPATQAQHDDLTLTAGRISRNSASGSGIWLPSTAPSPASWPNGRLERVTGHDLDLEAAG
jgi:hypothetical protein